MSDIRVISGGKKLPDTQEMFDELNTWVEKWMEAGVSDSSIVMALELFRQSIIQAYFDEPEGN